MISSIDQINGYISNIHQSGLSSIGFLNEERLNHVCCLKKALYVLKYASRMWFKCLREFLIDRRFFENESDALLFVRKGRETMYILVYVDDIIMTGSSANKMNQWIEEMKLKFKLRIVRKLEYFLGIRIKEHNEGHVDIMKDISNLLNL